MSDTAVTANDENTFPGLILGINSMFSTIWWVIVLTIYVKNHSLDEDMKSIAGTDSMPIAWFWERLGEPSGPYVYLSWSVFFTFWGYMIVSMIEFVAWIVYLVGGPGFFSIYTSIVGYWGVTVVYAMPVIFAVLHVAITLESRVTASPGSYCLFLIIGGTIFWMLNVVLHVVYTPQLGAYAKTIQDERPEVKKCPLKKRNMTDVEY
jgi:hypothetical protein